MALSATNETIEIGDDTVAAPELVAFIDAYCDQHGVDDGLRFKMHLVTEELTTNTIRHGYGGRDGWLKLSIAHDADHVTLTLEDAARPFDPTHDAPLPDLEADVEARAVGGLGIYLVKELADAVQYRRVDTGNRVEVVLSNHVAASA